MNKQQLANRIWASANSMRNKIDANEYKDYILGLIFYKFLSDTEIKFLASLDIEEDDLPNVVEDENNPDMATLIEECQKRIGFFIEYKYLFNTWLETQEFDVKILSEALSSFDRLMSADYEPVYEGIFTTLREGLTKLGDSAAAQTKALKKLIDLIKDIPTDGSQDYDVLGYVYEYLISNFAANAGKKAGEFYTPHEVAMAMSQIVADHHKDKESLEIYDPTSGSGSLLITIGKAVGKHITGKNKIKYYAQELKENTYNLTRMNLVMRGIIPANIITRCADSLEEDWPIHEEGIDIDKPLAVDAVVSNPPYSQHWDIKGKETDARFIGYGVAPKTKADYAFLLHELHHLKHDGIMTIIMPHGVLFRGKAPKKFDENGRLLPMELQEEGQGEAQIRSNLIEKNNIDAIIGLPANIFFGTGIPTLIMVLKKNRGNEGVLIIDASKGFVKDGKQNRLRACDVKRIADTYRDRKTIPGYSREVSRDEIRRNEYNLNIPRYVDSSEAPEKFDIYATMFGGIPNAEIDDLSKFWETFPSLRNELFEPVAGQPTSVIKSGVISERINSNADVIKFKESFAKAFEDFGRLLRIRLIDHIEEVKDIPENDHITNEIFTRMEDLPLVDRYAAYQILANHWQDIMGDVEVIQTEGFGACNAIDPKYKIVKKDDKTEEVTDGEKGRIMPFDLVQTHLLPNELAALNKLIAAKEEQDSILDGILGNLDAEEQEQWLNDDNTKWDKNKVTKAWNEVMTDVTTPEIEMLNEYLTLSKRKEKQDFIASHPSPCWDLMEPSKDNTFTKAIVKKQQAALALQVEFDEESTEGKLKRIVLAMERSSDLSKQIKQAEIELLELTKDTIKTMDMNTINQMLEIKWIAPITSGIDAMPNKILDELANSIKLLEGKYATRLVDVHDNISRASSSLASLIDELTGTQHDMQAMQELKSLLINK
jgi:type I restriction enzyme M protein